MTFVTWKILHTPYSGGWESGTTEVVSFINPSVTVSLEDGRDSFSFTVTDFNNESSVFYKANDKLTIYRKFNASTFEDDNILLVGTIKDVPSSESYNSNKLEIKGYNFSDSIMSGLVFVDLQGLRINEGLQLALENATGRNQNFEVSWDSSNQSVRSDGSAFPIITGEGRQFNKTLKSVFSKFSSNEYTQDGTYRWYVTSTNTLKWFDPSKGNAYSFNSRVDAHKELKIGKDVSDVKNWIVLKGGDDPQGNQIQTRFIDYASVNKHGTKYHFIISEKNNAQNLVLNDLKLSYGKDVLDNSYPIFPFTSTWKSESTGDYVTADDSGEYVEVVRAHILSGLWKEGQAFAAAHSYGTLKVDVGFIAGSKDWWIGDLISCLIPEVSEYPKILRVKQATFTSTVDTFSLEEDEGSL